MEAYDSNAYPMQVEIEITSPLREKLQDYSRLHDFYGALLTERQNTCFVMHYMEDYSLTEIAEALDITPQAVAGQLKRTIAILQEYEAKLGFIKRLQRIGEAKDLLASALALLDETE